MYALLLLTRWGTFFLRIHSVYVCCMVFPRQKHAKNVHTHMHVGARMNKSASENERMRMQASDTIILHAQAQVHIALEAWSRSIFDCDTIKMIKCMIINNCCAIPCRFTDVIELIARICLCLLVPFMHANVFFDSIK